MTRLTILALAFLTTGCTTMPRSLISRLVPPATDQFARNVIDSLQHASPQAVMTFLTPDLATHDGIADSIAKIQRTFPTGRPDSLLIVSANVFTQWNGATQRTIGYQLHATGKWALVVLTVAEQGDSERVSGLRVWNLTASLQTLNALTLQHASTGALIAALLAIAVLTLSLYAAVQVVRSPLKRRWLWAIVALIGFGKFGVQWNSGVVTQQWMAIQIFGTGLSRDGFYGPWWILVSMPGGAILALERRRRAIAEQALRHNGRDGDADRHDVLDQPGGNRADAGNGLEPQAVPTEGADQRTEDAGNATGHTDAQRAVGDVATDERAADDPRR